MSVRGRYNKGGEKGFNRVFDTQGLHGGFPVGGVQPPVG